MTENEAIKELQVGYLGDTENLVQAKHIAIKALEEIQQYRAIGTVEEFKELKENHIRCEDCAGCTSWKCDCANVRDYAIREFAERLNKRLHCAFSDDLEIQKYVDEIAEELRGEEC